VWDGRGGGVNERDFLGGEEAGGKGRQQAGTKNYMYLEGDV